MSTQQLAPGEVIFERPWGPFLEHSMRSPHGETLSRLLLTLPAGSGNTTPVCNVGKQKTGKVTWSKEGVKKGLVIHILWRGGMLIGQHVDVDNSFKASACVCVCVCSLFGVFLPPLPDVQHF